MKAHIVVSQLWQVASGWWSLNAQLQTVSRCWTATQNAHCTTVLFTALMKCRRGLAMRILSVCPSVRHTRELWQNGRTLYLDFYTIRKNIWPSFLRRRMVVGVTPSTWNFGSTHFEPIIARSASAVTPSEKSSINTNRKSTTRFPMNPRWTSYVVPKPPKGVQNLNNKLR